MVHGTSFLLTPFGLKPGERIIVSSLSSAVITREKKEDSTFVLKENGDLYASGSNASAQLGFRFPSPSSKQEDSYTNEGRGNPCFDKPSTLTDYERSLTPFFETPIRALPTKIKDNVEDLQIVSQRAQTFFQINRALYIAGEKRDQLTMKTPTAFDKQGTPYLDCPFLEYPQTILRLLHSSCYGFSLIGSRDALSFIHYDGVQFLFSGAGEHQQYPHGVSSTVPAEEEKEHHAVHQTVALLKQGCFYP